MADPMRIRIHGGNEVEMEAVLGYIRTQDDLRKKVFAGSQYRQQEDSLDEEAEADAQPRPPRPQRDPKFRPKPKPPNTPGR